ncbi:MATE family efflux transporter [Nonomuraea sp. KM88]|uniref:MATE family efflux transporter n=1 Tax=Nonomuraea sp. KM88 TaxID=3457427 RepID=UPI003FCE1895
MGRRGPAVRDHAQSLGSRPIGPLLWWACSQTTLSVGVYGIYALTNAWFVARGVGESALAAVNLVAPILLMLGAVSTTVGVGGASVVSRSLGAGRPDQAARAAGNAFVVFWLVALSVTVAGLLVLDPLLAMLGGSGPTMAYARPYAAVIIAGAIFSTGFSALVRAEGRLRFSTMLWVLPVLVQIVVDPLLIFVCGLGAAGAALGTVGGQAVSAGMAVWFFFVQRDRPYRIRPADLRPHPATIGAVLSVGAPSFLAGFGATLLAALINTTLAATGALALAAYAVCARLQTFVFTPQIGITQGIQLRRRTTRRSPDPVLREPRPGAIPSSGSDAPGPSATPRSPRRSAPCSRCGTRPRRTWRTRPRRSRHVAVAPSDSPRPSIVPLSCWRLLDRLDCAARPRWAPPSKIPAERRPSAAQGHPGRRTCSAEQGRLAISARRNTAISPGSTTWETAAPAITVGCGTCWVEVRLDGDAGVRTRCLVARVELTASL